MSRMRLFRLAALAALAACQPHAAPPGPEPEESHGPALAVASGGAADTVALQDVIEEGRRLFHGAGLCYACHGGRLQGGPVAPALVGPERSARDTSFAFVLHTIRAGSPHTPMVAGQGGLNAGQMLQVANYVWAVSNGRSVP